MKNKKKRKTSYSLDTLQSIDTVEEPAIFKLNEDCTRLVFSFLCVKDRIRIQRVCKKWQILSKLPWTEKKNLNLTDDYIDYTAKDDVIQAFPIVKQVLHLCGSSLTKIRISFSEVFLEIGDLGVPLLELIHEHCPNLTEFYMFGMELSQNAAEYLTDNFNKFTDVEIGSCKREAEEPLHRFFQSNTKLRSVWLKFANNLSGSCLAAIPDTIKDFNVLECTRLTVENVKNSLKRCKNLRNLTFNDNIHLLMHIDDIIHALPNKLNLERLFLDTLEFGYSDNLVEQMNNLHQFINLRNVSLTGTTILCDGILTEIGKHCVHLTIVHLARSNRITDFGWQNFVKSLNLEHLIVSNVHTLSDNFLNYLSKSSLKSVQFGDVPVTNESLRSLIQKSENLEVLKVFNCKNVDIKMLESDALIITDQRPDNKMLWLHHGPYANTFKSQKISQRLIVQKERFVFL